MGRFLLENTRSAPRLSLYRLGPTPSCTLSEGGLESLPQRALRAVPRSIHYLERESYVDGNRASDRAQAQKSARFTATKKRSLSWNPVQQQQPPGMWAACLLKLPRAPSHPALYVPASSVKNGNKSAFLLVVRIKEDNFAKHLGMVPGIWLPD